MGTPDDPMDTSMASALATKYKVCASCDKRIQIDDAKCWHCGSVDFKPLPVPHAEPVTATLSESIDAQLAALGDFQHLFTRKEVQYLPKVLHPGERIKALTSGRHLGSTWLVVVTDQRIVFLDKGMVYGLRQDDLPLHQISSVSHKTGVIFGELHIASSGGHCIVENIPKDETLKVAAIISELVRSGDVVSQLERLATLVEKGILTKEEFEAQKAKLLS